MTEQILDMASGVDPTATWGAGDRRAFAQHLATQGGCSALEEYIRRGGSFVGYARGWQVQRAADARATTPTTELLDRILDLTVVRKSQGTTTTMRSYLGELVVAVLAGHDDVVQYGLAGNSDWRYDLYDALIEAGLVPGYRDGDGLGSGEAARAKVLIAAAVGRMTAVAPA